MATELTELTEHAPTVTLTEEAAEMTLNVTDKPIAEIIKEAIHTKTAKGSDSSFFICNLGQLIRKYEEWTSHLPRVKPYYAMKCNDNEMILKTLAALGTGFDCASKGEITKLTKLGIPSSKIIYANPAKMSSHLLAAKRMGVTLCTFDNSSELYKIKKLYPEIRLILRIRCDDVTAHCQLGIKFGASLTDAPKLLSTAQSLGLNVVGVSFHVGSGCRNEAIYHKAIGKASVVFGVAKSLGMELSILDIGGGFPGNKGTCIDDFASVVNGALNEFFPESSGVEIIAEPGRFFAASPFTLVTQIYSRREIEDDDTGVGGKDFMYYINDGVYGCFNNVLLDHAIAVPHLLKNVDDHEKLYSCSIFGPTCDSLDLVCPEVNLPELHVGDYLYFNDMGAYTLVVAGTFNGFPVAKVFYYYSSWKTIKALHGGKKKCLEEMSVLSREAVAQSDSPTPPPTGGGVVNDNGVLHLSVQ